MGIPKDYRSMWEVSIWQAMPCLQSKFINIKNEKERRLQKHNCLMVVSLLITDPGS